ncbi:AfsR/SARP family transcriptional regulator [Streptomyces boluensis]|uniref:AfsR/SARP family transcriptional regulator n=1 Tax=Streptomyces boluensis TaxID=1775135 RepID=UPI0028A6A645|nr:BTAD domain-containing putative transcriptional regulator [Streptomyces boluensis]
MRIGILGPIELRHHREIDRLGSTKERLALAALACDAGHPVSLDTLVHRLWDEAPPAKPRASLHAYVARIRKRLRACGLGDRLVQQARSYTLTLDPAQVDSHLFQQLSAQARGAADRGDDDTALQLLDRAEELWRGDPLTGLPGLWAERTRAGLSEKRLAAHLTRSTIGLRRGHFAELVPDITLLLDRHPDDEALAGLLIVANYGCGRQSEALRVYDTVRRHLRERLGTDPGEALTRLHRLVLNGAPVDELLPRPRTATVTATATAPTAVVPRTLPSHAELVGRTAELSSIVHAAPAAGAGPETGVVIALQTISGMAGVGKSLLALHAADELAPLFPDGQLYLDLQAHSPNLAPLAPADALAALLRTLGVPAASVPDGLQERVGLWRTLLSSRRAVIVLDDAADADQLGPLLPGPSASLVIVTSRRRITGLPGMRAVLLDVLPPEDAAGLFHALAGAGPSVTAHEVSDIVRLCGHLPLAIELAARRLLSRPSWTPAHLLQRLSQGHSRLAELRDGYREIARAFEVSYLTLTSTEQQVFRLLGLHLGADFDAYATAALTDLSPARAERVLEVLLDSHLIQEPTPERYVFHDLLGEYSRTLSMSEEAPADRDRAIHRLVDFYVQAATAADHMIYPRRPHPVLPPVAPRDQIPAWEGPLAARQWFTSERAGLIAAERHCRTQGQSREAALLAAALANYLDEEAYASESVQMHTAAAQHWNAAGERRAEVFALLDLGAALSRRARYEDALTTATRALRYAQDIGDDSARADSLHLLGVLNWNLGRLSDAHRHQTDALSLRLRAGDPWQIARSHNNLGIVCLFRGDLSHAETHFTTALAAFRSLLDSHEEARVLNNLSDLYQKANRTESARAFLSEALAILTRVGSPLERAITQTNLADAMNSPDEIVAKLDLYQDSLATFRRLGDLRNASITLCGMGAALLAAGRVARAADEYRRALDLARSIGAAHEESVALHGLGLAARRRGDLAVAVAHLEGAIVTAEQVGAAGEAALARESLAALRSVEYSTDSAYAKDTSISRRERHR